MWLLSYLVGVLFEIGGAPAAPKTACRGTLQQDARP
jgi:hypothetical protein